MTLTMGTAVETRGVPALPDVPSPELPAKPLVMGTRPRYSDEDREVPTDITRDRWDRPLIELLDGSGAVAYTRASSLGKKITDTFNLSEWGKRAVAVGMSRRPDLVRAASVLDLDKSEDRKPLTDIVKRAMDSARAKDGSDWGTALHKASELHEAGADLSHIDSQLRMALNVYLRMIAPATIHATETFTVNDKWQAAGSFDRLVSFPHDIRASYYDKATGRNVEIFIPAGTRLIVDIKTGKLASRKYWGAEYGSQQATYGHGRPYVPGQGDRGRVKWPDGIWPSEDYALILHIPHGHEDQAKWVLVDLADGARLAKLAALVRDDAKPAKSLFIDIELPGMSRVHAPGDVHAAQDVEYLSPVELPAGLDSGEHGGNSGAGSYQEPAAGLDSGEVSPLAALVANEDAVVAAAFMPPAADDGPAPGSDMWLIMNAESVDELNELYDQTGDKWTDEHVAAAQAQFAKLAESADLVSVKIAGAETADELNGLYDEWQGIWTDEHTAAANERMAALRQKLSELIAGAQNISVINGLYDQHGQTTIWTDEHSSLSRARYDYLTTEPPY